jgi:2-polyprenyl-3-methyl-5-hydroxy-6-metoxy-1,4-benzoquinol methylase
MSEVQHFEQTEEGACQWPRREIPRMSKETSETNNNQKTRTGTDYEYIFENSRPETESRFSLLSSLFDERSIHYIEQRGIKAGWSCLEVGGGGGSIAAWLSSRVGHTGRVLATDIDPRFLQTLSCPNLEVRRHDLRVDPIPEREFDLVHARLVLMHLPERETVLKRMIAALKPGGWIVLEEIDNLAFLPNQSSVDCSDEVLKVREAFQQVLTDRGVDNRYGRGLARSLQANGVVNIGAEVNGSMWKSGSAGTSLMKLACNELRGIMVGSSLITESEFEADMKRADEPDFLMPSPLMWTAWGQLGG